MILDISGSQTILFGNKFPEYPHAYYMDLLRTDNVIVASSHGFRWEEDQSGELTLTVFPGQLNIRCGKTKENCFSLVVSHPNPSPPTSYDDPLWYHGGSFTSGATVHLSAIAFYLAQFFPTAEEIVSILRTCAIDVGEPGPDEEYGVGVVNLFCPEVFQKEAEVYVSSLKSTGKSSSVLQELTHRTPAGLSFRSAVGFGFQGVQGYAGVSYTTSAFQATVLAGFSDAPLWSCLSFASATRHLLCGWSSETFGFSSFFYHHLRSSIWRYLAFQYSYWIAHDQTYR